MPASVPSVANSAYPPTGNRSCQARLLRSSCRAAWPRAGAGGGYAPIARRRPIPDSGRVGVRAAVAFHAMGQSSTLGAPRGLVRKQTISAPVNDIDAFGAKQRREVGSCGHLSGRPTATPGVPREREDRGAGRRGENLFAPNLRHHGRTPGGTARGRSWSGADDYSTPAISRTMSSSVRPVSLSSTQFHSNAARAACSLIS